jgi:Na+-driven multidrug efflux pump
MQLLAPWLAGHLAESVLTREYATFALRLVPLACLTGALFLLCRPVFEAMNRWQPGLVMAAFRYLVLTVPLAWAGIVIARATGDPPLYGLLAGLLVTAALSSIAFALWLRRTLAATR